MANRNSPRTTTTVTPSPLSGKRATSLSKGHTPLRRVQVTPDLIGSPETAARIVSDLQDNIQSAIEGPNSNPFNFSHIAQNVTLTNGVQANVNHSLGVAWKYAFIINQYPGAGPISAIVGVATSSYPSGLDKTKVCSFIPWGYLVLQGTLTLVAGTKTITVGGLTSSSFASVSVLTPGGTLGSAYQVVPSANSLAVTAINSAGTLVNTDTSTLSYMVSIPSTGSYDILIVGQ